MKVFVRLWLLCMLLVSLARAQTADVTATPLSDTDIQLLRSDLQSGKNRVQKHHTFTRDQLTLIQKLASKVERKHGNAHPEVYKVNEALAIISADLAHHFFCEENVLFPYIEQLDQKQTSVVNPAFDTIQQPVTRMMKEHDQTGDELRALREITNHYRPPEDACTTYRALYRAMEDLERDLHRHIHLENNILFPRAQSLESGRS